MITGSKCRHLNKAGRGLHTPPAYQNPHSRFATHPFRIYDLRSTYATRLRAGGVADEFVTQLLRQGDAKVFRKYSYMKLQMKREAQAKVNRQANETGRVLATAQGSAEPGFGTVLAQ